MRIQRQKDSLLFKIDIVNARTGFKTFSVSEKSFLIIKKRKKKRVRPYVYDLLYSHTFFFLFVKLRSR